MAAGCSAHLSLAPTDERGPESPCPWCPADAGGIVIAERVMADVSTTFDAEHGDRACL